ncbi:cold-shock protein [Chitinophaga sp. sic0106]|uniref:cold-shock protein n=1 Tax=Chitinophaga sp. sic0106 TaxID=2854785 RepID=UPI001C4418C7|nr:cold shock domain-containing protein [Chitinophaga sp. sic0106]MBV7530059.1 cold shock domain-containing protein [Chitinophaga sp. sic0106]
MARSQETFNKQEFQKKKQQKKQEKADRKEERQSKSNKGKSLEDMMAYLDENGNLTTVPPDPSKKKEVNLEDIQIGVARQQEEAEDPVRTGVVTFYNDGKGFGFIKDSRNQESYFVHINQSKDPLKENVKVSFELGKGPKGPIAINVQVIK